MKLQQLRYVCEVARRGLNVSAAAAALHTSQPGISKRVREHSPGRARGTLTLAATHTQARYALPKAVTAFKRRYPKVQLVIHQGNPTQICEEVAAGGGEPRVAT